MSQRRYVLAVDQGSSGTKAAVFDDTGRPLRQARRRTAVAHPEVVAAEADPEGWWRALVECVGEVLEGPVPAGRIEAVALCGFMHTLVPVGDDGAVTGPALLWPDQRPLADAPPAAASGSCVERIRWWTAGNPGAAARTRWYLPVKDFLRLRLTGTVGTDAYEAGGTGFVDAATGTWSPATAAHAGITVDRLPPIRGPLDIAGEVTEAAAALTGLVAGTPVAVGTGDWMATLLGSAAVLPGRACVYLGTAGAIGGFASPSAAARLAEPLCFAAATATGSALDWLAGLVTDDDGGGGGAGALAEAAGEVPPGARGVVFLPHLMGERGDGPRPAARGAVLGLTLAHGRADLARAVLEGTAMWLRAIAGVELERRDPAELVAVGGGARSDLWLRVLAAVLDRDLTVPETTEAGLLGGALIAATAVDLGGQEGQEGQGGSGLADRRDRWVRAVRTVPAEPGLVKDYQPLYDEFLRVEALAVAADADRWEPHEPPRPVPGRGRHR
ncbi:xylulokinase [Streptosporangium sp. NBC_01469]|uniref:xylulokinase n=1 Tax=Streptosporangium sp. NBC_01469 TaxID=2903898 RepID=UPI002E2B1753|nr:FGGY family carbohydrate kinase [Streptosporangium sp. NBC_01469]